MCASAESGATASQTLRTSLQRSPALRWSAYLSRSCCWARVRAPRPPPLALPRPLPPALHRNPALEPEQGGELTIGAVGVHRPGRQDLAGDQVLQGRVQREGAVHDPGLPPDEAADHRRLQRDAQRLGEPPRPARAASPTALSQLHPRRRTRPARSGSTRSGRSTTATPTVLCWCTTSRTSTRSPA